MRLRIRSPRAGLRGRVVQELEGSESEQGAGLGGGSRGHRAFSFCSLVHKLGCISSCGSCREKGGALSSSTHQGPKEHCPGHSNICICSSGECCTCAGVVWRVPGMCAQLTAHTSALDLWRCSGSALSAPFLRSLCIFKSPSLLSENFVVFLNCWWSGFLMLLLKTMLEEK